MKKKILLSVLVPLLVCAVLFVPIPRGVCEDGGTRDYRALTYRLVVWNRIMEFPGEGGASHVPAVYRGVSVYWFSEADGSIDDLFRREMQTERYQNQMKR